MFSLRVQFISLGFFLIFSAAIAQPKYNTESPPHDEDVNKLMTELKQANKKYKWNESLFNQSGWKIHGRSAKGRPLIYFVCGENNTNTTLILSAVHGDEITPVYYGFRFVMWALGEPDLCKKHRIVVAPLINPDGHLSSPPVRTNGNGVDLNRNFKTHDFEEKATKLWKTEQKSNPRKFPGKAPNSEPETTFQIWLIDEFKPNKILSVHSPLNFFDYDGPESEGIKVFTKEYVKSCEQLRMNVRKVSNNYNFLRFGFYPGSLGNYAGSERGIPTLTLELPTVDAAKARSYFERLKDGNRALVTYTIKDQ